MANATWQTRAAPRRRSARRLTADPARSAAKQCVTRSSGRATVGLLKASYLTDVKIFKPSSRVYHLTPEHFRVHPFGLGFVPLDPERAELSEELTFTADHTVTTITDLLAFLRA